MDAMRLGFGRAVTAACVLATALTLLGASAASAQNPPPAGQECAAGAQRVLLFGEAAAAGVVAAGRPAICAAAGAAGIAVDYSDDSAVFNATALAPYDAVVFLANTGDILADAEQAALEAYVRGGGGAAGIGAAAAAEPAWGFWATLIGARAGNRSTAQPATVEIYDRVNPATAGLPVKWTVTDGWYAVTPNPRANAHVLAGLDEASYDEGTAGMGRDHPVSWCKDIDQGRSWYTSIGNEPAVFDDARVRDHLRGGIETAIGGPDVECGATVWRNFQKVQLTRDVGEPMDLAVLPGRRVLMTDRRGRLRLHDPVSGVVSLAAEIPVYAGEEDGLQTVAIDPDFETNDWVYLYYSRPESAPCSQADINGGVIKCGVNRLSRFKFDGAKLDLTTEQAILDVPTQRDLCCHVGGDIGFDSKGNLLLSTGDNTNSWASDGFSPIDERPNRGPFDAQRSSGNTNDLRGKLLRIKVAADGSYTAPPGNLFGPEGRFPAVTGKTRSEIYSMGHRNPFRFTVDPVTDWVYMGEVGPDAGSDNSNRGPRQYEELNIIKRAGNGGWPHCIANSASGAIAYRDYNFATGQSGPAFDCANGPVNDSPNNTGLTQLPPVDNLPTIWYPYGNFEPFPELGSGGGTAMGGPVYRYDDELESDTKWPAYFDGSEIFYEWSRSYLKDVKFDGDGNLMQINPMFGGGIGFSQPMDMEFGPDGSLYVIEYGGGFFTVGPNVGLYRLDYVKGRHRPDIRVTTDKDSGQEPLTVEFDASGSSDQDGDALTFAWDFTGDGTNDATTAVATHTYEQPGVYNAKVTVTDATSRSATQTVRITVGNTRPEVQLVGPVDGGFFEWTDVVGYEIQVTDPEDTTIDCDEVLMKIGLGHDEHAHPIGQQEGCEGEVVTDVIPEGHSPNSRLFYVLEGSYTDHSATGSGALEGKHEVTLRPKFWEAELYDRSQGVQQTQTSSASAGRRVGSVSRGDWWAYERVNLRNIDSITLRVSSGSNNNGRVELRIDAPDGPLIGEIPVPNTGGWDTYRTLDPALLSNVPEGTHVLYMVGADDQGGDLLDVDWIRFNGRGVATRLATDVTATPSRGAAPLATTLRADEPDAPAGATYEWDFGDGETGTGATVEHTYATPGAYEAEVTIKLGGEVISTAKTTVRAFEKLEGTLDVTPQTATPFVNDDATVSARFEPAGAQSAEGRDVTFQVFRRSELTPRPAGYTTGTPYPRVDEEVVQTDASGVARFTYTGEVLASDIVIACLAYGDSCLQGSETTLMVGEDGGAMNLRRGVDRGRSQLDWKFRADPNEWKSLWDGQTFAGWDHAGSGSFQRVIDDDAPALQAQGSGGILWFNARQFADYELKVAYEHNGVSDNGGIFLRFPNPGEDRSVANEGYQVAILDRVDDVSTRTGSVLGFATAQKLNAKPVGEGYNTFRIRFVGKRIEVYLNEDVQANADPVAVYEGADRATQGFVGIENNGSSIRYKDIAIKEIKAATQRPLVRVSATPQSGPAPLEVAFRGDATDPSGQGITYAWEFGDGEAGSGQNVTHTYDEAGYYTARVTATDAAGERSSAAIEISVASNGECLDDDERYCRVDLTGHFNNDGISEQGDFDDGNFDDAGWAFAGDALPPAGPVTLLGVPFEFPSYVAGRRNTIEARGQTLPLTDGKYDQVELLVSAHHGSHQPNATLVYADGSVTVPLRVTDWAQSPQFGERIAIAMDHRHDQDSDTGPPVNIFLRTLPLDPDRELREIRLPNENRVHVFAMTLKVVPTCTQTATPGVPLIGTDGDDVLCGTPGADVLEGGGGDDILRGGAGDDTLRGGEGDDECNGQAGTDTATGCEVEISTSNLSLAPGHASVYTDEDYEVSAAFGGDDAVPNTTPVHFEVREDGETVQEGDGTAAAPFEIPRRAVGSYEVVACTGAQDCDAAGVTRMARATFKVIEIPELEHDYELLFDGQDKDGWVQSGPGVFNVDDESLVTDGGLGLLWHETSLGDFSLRMSWKVEDGTDNSGVFARFPDGGTNTHNVAINEGHEIQIHEGANTSEPQKTGSVYNFQREQARNSNPIGEWNDYEIRAKGRTFEVFLNGELVNTWTGTDPRTKLEGHIGLQNHDPNSHVHFRYVRVKELEAVAPVTTASLGEPGPGGAYTGPVTITLEGADEAGGSGVDRTEYRLDGGDWTRYEQPLRVTANGRHVLEYRSVDRDFNVEATKRAEFMIDTLAPVTTAALDPAAPNGPAGAYRAPVTVTLTAADAGVGVDRIEYSLDGGGWTPYGGPVVLTRPGQHVLRYRSVDRAGHTEAERELRLRIVGPPAAAARPDSADSAFELRRLPARSAAGFAQRGLKLRMTCEEAVEGTARVLVTHARARSLGLHSRVLARRVMECDEGERLTIVLRPGAAARRALLDARGAVNTVVDVRMRAEGERMRKVQRRLSLR
jgi:cytochrome c